MSAVHPRRLRLARWWIATAVVLGAVVLGTAWLVRDDGPQSLDGLSREETIRVLNEHPELARELERKNAEIDYALPAQSLAEALSDATLAVRGRVVDVRFTADYWVYATVEVERFLLGDDAGTGRTVSMVQMGGPEVRSPGDVHEVWLVEPSAAPLLLEGDEAIVFLMPASTEHGPNTYWTRPVTSIYRIEDNRIIPVAENPFGRLVADLSVEQFEERVMATVATRR